MGYGCMDAVYRGMRWDGEEEEFYSVLQYLIMDAFGFKTQGINYDKFRPRYPQTFFDRTLALLPHRRNYLDIATGTGLLLFALAPHFQRSRGVDISKNMLDTAEQSKVQFLSKNPTAQVQLGKCGVMDLPQDQKYDLVTVGQALHFFPGEAPLIKIRSLLAQGGCFSVFGYVIKQVLSSNPKEDQLFNRYYGKVKPHFPIDRDDLHNFLSDPNKYPFQRVFPKVERELVEVPLPMSKQEYLAYMRTMSGYNIYLEKFKEDPLEEVEKNGAEEVNCVLYYFRIACFNP